MTGKSMFCSPAVLHFPFGRLTVLVQIHSHQGHGMAATTIETLHTLLLVHTESCIEQTSIIIVFQVKQSATIKELAYITTEIKHGAVLQAGNGHLLDILDRKIEIQPVMSVVSMTVEFNFIYFVERTGRIVHQHHIVLIQILATTHVLIEALRSVGFRSLGIFAVFLRSPGKRLHRFAISQYEHAVDSLHLLHLFLLQIFLALSLSRHVA